MSALICDRCGARVLPADVLPPTFDLGSVNKLREAMNAAHPERPAAPPLTEYKPDLCHQRVSYSGGQAGVYGSSRRTVGRCGPLREATEWDEWLWRLGAVRP